jgi:hypothetical protein
MAGGVSRKLLPSVAVAVHPCELRAVTSPVNTSILAGACR